MRINKIKEFIKNHKEIVIPLMFFFVTFFVFNFLAPHQSHDKEWPSLFDKYGGFSFDSFIKLTVDWFYTKNNRLPIELLAVLFVQNPVGIIIFRMINPIFATIVFYLILRVVNSKSIQINMILYLMVFTIDGSLVYQVGLTSVCSNYIWPLALATPSLLIMLEVSRNKSYQLSIKHFVLSLIPLLIYALWSEILALILVVTSIFSLILYYINNKKINKHFVIYASISLAFLIFALVAPSNKVRYETTIKNYFPTYPQFSFFSKCWFSVVETYNDYMKLFNLIFILFLAYVVFKDKTSNKLLKINALIPILHFVIYNCLFNSYTLTYNQGLNDFYTKYLCVIHRQWSAEKLTVTGVPFLGAFFGILFYSHVLISLIFLKTGKEKKILLIFLYLLGLMTKACLGFTPRYYVTYRTSFYVVVSTFMLTGIILNNLCLQNEEKLIEQ